MVMSYINGGLYFRLNQHMMGKIFDDIPKAGHLDVGDRPYPFIRCSAKGTKIEVMNYFDVDDSPPDLQFDFDEEQEIMHEQILEKLQERAKIG